MALLSILEYPDKRLRTLASPVLENNDEIQKLISNMFETMYEAPGVGLAATQVNIHKRIITIDTSDNQKSPLVLINPEFEVIDSDSDNLQEGCLSIPGFYETLQRPKHIKVTALDKNFKGQQFEATGLLAVCIQHEIDHLNGILYVDHISRLKRSRIKSKLEKLHKQQ
ncbi:MAG: peptide deformylase [Oceanospirillaceae bacterium]|nr:peptide deformylase [Oceanospirillaceae bacterium]